MFKTINKLCKGTHESHSSGPKEIRGSAHLVCKIDFGVLWKPFARESLRSRPAMGGLGLPSLADRMAQESAEEDTGETGSVVCSPPSVAGGRVEFSRRGVSLGHSLGQKIKTMESVQAVNNVCGPFEGCLRGRDTVLSNVRLFVVEICNIGNFLFLNPES